METDALISQESPEARRRSLIRAGIAMILLLSVALGLRVTTIAARGDLWVDETITAMLIGLGPADLLGRLAVSGNAAATGVHVHPPAYYPLLRGWARVFGDGEVGLRSFSALFGVLSVALLWLLLRRFFGPTLAWLSAAAAAVSAVQVYYSSEARYYALFLFLTLISLYFFLDILRNGRGHIAYIIAATLCMYTFYYGVYVILSENVLFLAMGGWRDRRRLSLWVLTQVVLVLAFLPWTPVLQRHIGAYPAVNFSSWSKYFTIMKTPLLDLMAFGGSVQAELVAAVAFALLVILGLLSRSPRNLRTAAFWLAWIVIPVLAHRFTGTIVIRTRAYIFLAPAVAVLAALPVASWLEARRWGRALAAGTLFAVFLAANLMASVQTWQRTRAERSSHSSLVQLDDLLRKEAGPGSALVLNRGKLVPLVDYYLDRELPTIGFWAYPGEDRRARVMDSLERLSEVYDEFWLVTIRGKGQAPWNDLVAVRAPETPRVDYQHLSIQRVSSSVFRQSDAGRDSAGWTTGDGVASRVVVLDSEAVFGERIEVLDPARLELDVLTSFPNRRPFHGVLELHIDGRCVASGTVGSDFASLYRLEEILEPGSHELSVLIRDP
ncbi:MAG: glycosyltransferase family 39 protein [Thermoanaerobaculales bacterium]|nr:glycosyltransferase family 39 protein [Thermoanaerobaculales bacterium]